MGNHKTRDEVLRREMRQQESGWISTLLVERGKIRLQRLGYFDEVNVDTPAVPGSADQVDVNYTVEERPFGNFIAGLGYSQTEGLHCLYQHLAGQLSGERIAHAVCIQQQSFQSYLQRRVSQSLLH